MTTDTIIIIVVVAAALACVGRSVYRALTGKGGGCGCGKAECPVANSGASAAKTERKEEPRKES
jgi:hypothetical protein